MFTRSMVSVLAALALSSFALAGCAADAEDAGFDQEKVVVHTDESEITPSYTPNVTIKDIKAGFGTCVGTYCTINGTQWDCSGGGTCKYLGHTNQ